MMTHNVFLCIGYNCRMAAIQAAMGLVHLHKLDGIIEKREKNADYFTKHIKKMKGIEPPFVREDVKHVYWAYGTLILEEELGISRDRFDRSKAEKLA